MYPKFNSARQGLIAADVVYHQCSGPVHKILHHNHMGNEGGFCGSVVSLRCLTLATSADARENPDHNKHAENSVVMRWHPLGMNS